jgi:hypothetical protein
VLNADCDERQLTAEGELHRSTAPRPKGARRCEAPHSACARNTARGPALRGAARGSDDAQSHRRRTHLHDADHCSDSVPRAHPVVSCSDDKQPSPACTASPGCRAAAATARVCTKDNCWRHQ